MAAKTPTQTRPTSAAAPKAKPKEKPRPKSSAPPPAAPAAGAQAQPPRPRPITKALVIERLIESTGLTRKQIVSVFDGLNTQIARELGRKGPGLFQIPNLVKLRLERKPATKAKQGINPFTKEPMTIKAKPARNIVKAVPMKALKELV